METHGVMTSSKALTLIVCLIRKGQGTNEITKLKVDSYYQYRTKTSQWQFIILDFADRAIN